MDPKGTEMNDSKEEDGSPGSSSGSGSSTRGGEGISMEKQHTWEEEQEHRDTISALPAFAGPPLKKTHTRTLGVLKLRADDDDDPTDWWFASTAIPLIAATFAPMANVLSIAGLVVYWRNKIIQPPGPDYNEMFMETSIGLKDPTWYAYYENTASQSLTNPGALT